MIPTRDPSLLVLMRFPAITKEKYFKVKIFGLEASVAISIDLSCRPPRQE
jgi:hypothetical protein